MKERKKRSVIWNVTTDEEFKEMVKNSKTYGEILRKFDLTTKGGNIKTLRYRIEKLNIDDSHIAKGISSNLGRKFFKEKIPLENILVENSTYCRHDLKKRIKKENLLPNKCNICGQEPLWNNKELVLVLDHYNGIYNDNRIENLRLLCPNCHSQTPTFAGRKLKKRYLCPECGKEILKKSKLCTSCNNLKIKERIDCLNNKKCIHPIKETLEELIKNQAMTKIGQQYGVSGNSVKKWAIKYEIFQHSKFRHKKNMVPVVGVEPTCTN